MSAAAKGRRLEHLVRDDMVDHDWITVARSAGSRGPADLVMVHPWQGLALIQVGTGNKALGPADRVRLLKTASLCSALPILAVVERGRITYQQVGAGTARTWEGWSP